MAPAASRGAGPWAAVGAVVVTAVGVFVASALAWRWSDGPHSAPSTAGCSTDGGAHVHAIDELPNVENTLFALDSVWAVTSDLPDNFSPGPANASLLRIDTCTRRVLPVLRGLSEQPILAEVGGLVWAKLDDRIVAFDEHGDELASIAWEARGTIVGGEDQLWATDFDAGMVAAIDPVRAEIVRMVDTGSFPVAPIVAFAHVWVPSSIDGVVTVIDEATLGRTTTIDAAITDEQLTDVTPVPNGPSGDEVWVTTIEGELFALSAEVGNLGARRSVPVEREVNRLVAVDGRVVLLPTWGQRVLVGDPATGEVLDELAIGSIPFRVVSDGQHAWVASDGNREMLTRIDPRALRIVEQFDVGTNSSNTTGPTQPFVVGDEVWVPNRGDDRIVIVATNTDAHESS